MATDAATTLKKLAREAELEVIEKADGHFIIVGGLVIVHWWPHSRRMTAYVEGAPQGRSYVTAKQVVNIATKGQP
ncbi:hypothetical protein M8A51_25710 [Schlegelella sp. S2-27]|uniref:BON domain-containing protein n=1 Tax=Caldimonas mangrovi TaxID=2944811 RepID=A0ABT0YWX3_9BURK|nr:hypothetical protein [Caldimonas mangrovi]MCM5682934.1 hypothetical protein [Caldimonas mangrovi]